MVVPEHVHGLLVETHPSHAMGLGALLDKSTGTGNDSPARCPMSDWPSRRRTIAVRRARSGELPWLYRGSGSSQVRPSRRRHLRGCEPERSATAAARQIWGLAAASPHLPGSTPANPTSRPARGHGAEHHGCDGPWRAPAAHRGRRRAPPGPGGTGPSRRRRACRATRDQAPEPGTRSSMPLVSFTVLGEKSSLATANHACSSWPTRRRRPCRHPTLDGHHHRSELALCVTLAATNGPADVALLATDRIDAGVGPQPHDSPRRRMKPFTPGPPRHRLAGDWQPG